MIRAATALAAALAALGPAGRAAVAAAAKLRDDRLGSPGAVPGAGR